MAETKSNKWISNIPSHYKYHFADTSVLSADEEMELGNAAMSGDLVARKTLIEKNLKLVVSLAKQYRNQLIKLAESIELMELIQAGNIGLIKAADNFNPNIARFSTYAHSKIRFEIIRLLAREDCSMRGITLNENRKGRQLLDFIKVLTQKMDKVPNEEEIAVAYSIFMEISIEKAREHSMLLKISRRFIKKQNDERGENLVDAIFDLKARHDEDIIRSIDTSKKMEVLLSGLTELERTMIIDCRKSSRKGGSIRSICKKLGITYEVGAGALSRAKRKMRNNSINLPLEDREH